SSKTSAATPSDSSRDFARNACSNVEYPRSTVMTPSLKHPTYTPNKKRAPHPESALLQTGGSSDEDQPFDFRRSRISASSFSSADGSGGAGGAAGFLLRSFSLFIGFTKMKNSTAPVISNEISALITIPRSSTPTLSDTSDRKSVV